ncbi:regulatory protein RecX [Marinobacter sp. SS21]|uniref:regulatory protein RecX n=1 Tax=Marinobacter sp. SS21 TaxID=2979460 RepID=UPI002330E2AD|nr:regulatory protein RecX [Marinobacter sp. SS21]MDC0664258.1 regulatory protein RecX [Marinobacter sp. SS21]
MTKAMNPEDLEQQIRVVALRLLARREHSRLELSTKLRQRRLPSDLIETVLDEFETEGWLSDDRFAEVFVRQRMDSGYGPIRIRGELQQKGVDGVPVCLAEIGQDDWSDRAIRVRERRFGLRDIQEDWPEKGRQARFLTQRGFSASQIERALAATEPHEE